MPVSADLKKLEPLPFEKQPPFEQRIRLIAEENNVLIAEVGKRAGLSHEAARKWVLRARENLEKGIAAPPGKPETIATVATCWGVPPAWLRDSAPLKKGAKLPRAESQRLDDPDEVELLALLRRAVEILERKARR